jgi:general secretion pathway protein H
MPMSATGNKRGFTLIEMLVVVFIIGLLSSVVVLAMPMGRDSLRQDTRALTARIKLVAQESVMNGAATGVLITPEGYNFYRLDAGKWIAMTGDRLFRPQTWRKGVVADVVRAGNAAPAPSVFERGKPPAPNVVFDPTGLATPFSVSLVEDGEHFVVSNTAKGEVVINVTP